MGGAISFFADPLDIFDQKSAAKLLDPIGGDPLGLSKIFGPEEGGGGFGGLVSKVAAEFAAGHTPPADPNLKPFRRPDRTPDTSEAQTLDRRRSISSAIMRRRARSSILTSTPGDTLGG